MNVTASFVSKFDSREIMTPADKFIKRTLFQAGGFTQKTAKRSMKRGGPKDRSQAGEAPVGHGNEIYKNFTYFAVDLRAQLVVIGSALVLGAQGDIAPEKIEFGGDELVWVGSGPSKHKALRHYEARPAMRLAYELMLKSLMPKLLAAGIVK